MYQYKTELDGKNLPFGFPQKNIDEIRKYKLPNDHKIKNTMISQGIATDKNRVPYGKGNSFPSLLLKIEDEVLDLIISMPKCHHPIRAFNAPQLVNAIIYKNIISGEVKFIKT